MKKGQSSDAVADFERVLKLTNHSDFAEPAKKFLRQFEGQANPQHRRPTRTPQTPPPIRRNQRPKTTSYDRSDRIGLPRPRTGSLGRQSEHDARRCLRSSRRSGFRPRSAVVGRGDRAFDRRRSVTEGAVGDVHAGRHRGYPDQGRAIAVSNPRLRIAPRADLGHVRRSHLYSRHAHPNPARRLSRSVRHADHPGNPIRREANRARYPLDGDRDELWGTLAQCQDRPGSGSPIGGHVDHHRRRRDARCRAYRVADHDLRSSSQSIRDQRPSPSPG